MVELEKQVCRSDWYDNFYKEKYNNQYEGDYRNNQDFEFWYDIMRLFERSDKLFEIGCGVGQFAEMLYNNGFHNYKGIDFSEIAIEKAKQRSQQNLEVANCYLYKYEPVDCFIAFEVLEHLESDIELIKRLPKGQNFIFSVPNFESLSHVRYFNNQDEITERYRHCLDIIEILEYKFNERIVYVIISTTK